MTGPRSPGSEAEWWGRSRLSLTWRQRLGAWLGNSIEYDLSPYLSQLDEIASREASVRALDDAQLTELSRTLRDRAREAPDDRALVPEAMALVRETSRRVLGQRPFDVQVLAGLVMLSGKVAELATGEGKTLAAVAPAYLRALSGQGVHVLTFNDYLARRDAAWMGPVYEHLGLTVGFVQEGMSVEQRRRAYRCDVTYVTAKEAGFDLLRDGLAHDPGHQVHRAFHFAVIDEADSILIDEARIPLVIAGGTRDTREGPEETMAIARRLRPGADFDTDEYQHNIALTETGEARAEELLGCGDLRERQNLRRFAELRNALHALVLLKRDLDYIVRDGRVELVDDHTGRVADKRQWPDGLQAALEAKEGVRVQAEGRILGSITLQHFVRLYPKLAGMTATAAAAAEELEQLYGLGVVVLPTHHPSRRVDHPDLVFTHLEAREAAVLEEVARTHRSGRPVLVGTASVADSERLAAALQAVGVPCRVLNARNDEREAEIVADAGALGAVTISTNMAGRGTDIRLGGSDESQRTGVVALGGLYLIGTSRHASRRVDQQLRGRAGRQGDPGESRFFVSLADDLLSRYGVENLITRRLLPPHQESPIELSLVHAEVDRVQRIVASEGYEMRKTLFTYSEPEELQRQTVQAWRRDALHGEHASRLAEERSERWQSLIPVVGEPALLEIERRLTLSVIDRCWSEYLSELREMRDDSHLLAYVGKVPVAEFHRQIGQSFLLLEERIDAEICSEFDQLEISAQGADWDTARSRSPSSTWTYLVGENPFGVSGYASAFHRPSMGFAAAILGPIVLLPGLGLLWRRRRNEPRTPPPDAGPVS